MESIFNFSTLCFYAFVLFLFTQLRHIKYYNGASKRFYISLVWFNTACYIVSIVYLVMYGISTKWWCPFVIIAIGTIPGGFLQGILSKIIPEYVLSILGFITLPVLGFLMYYLM